MAIISKTARGSYVGGVIDNAGLDNAIKEDMEPGQYPLEQMNMDYFEGYTEGHKKGTIIVFEDLKESLKSKSSALRKTIALSFRFSLIDRSFKIHVDDKEVTLDDLDELAEHTEFVWNINGVKDPFITKKLKYARTNLASEKNLQEPVQHISVPTGFKGFIASVRTPADLKITGTDERGGIDLFVNGRLREKDLLRHITTTKVPESYLYGQIHFDAMDDDKDRFSTSREGIVADDKKFESFLKSLREVVLRVISEWDPLRTKHRKEGDPDNPRLSKRDRKAQDLYNVVADDYVRQKGTGNGKKIQKVDEWVGSLAEDAKYNFPSYADCFISENLIRKHIKEKKIPLSPQAKTEVREMRKNEKQHKNAGNVSIQVRRTPIDLTYLSMDHLANLVDKKDRIKEASLSRDASEYKPIRDAIMHTALLTDDAKARLAGVFQNIRGRVKTLVEEK